MKKKEYINPCMTEVKIETATIIASSGSEPASSGDYTVGDWDTEQGSEDF